MPYAYAWKRSIVITAATTADQSNFRVLIKFDSSNVGTTFKSVANGGLIYSANAYDIAFSTDAAGASLLFWDVDYYDAVNGALWVWVNLVTYSHTVATTIYIFYGNPSITSAQGTPASVYQSGAKMVRHYTDSGTTSVDATGTVTSSTITNGTWVDGKIGRAISFSGTGGDDLGTPSILSMSTAFTIACWINFNSLNADVQRIYVNGFSLSTPFVENSLNQAGTTAGAAGNRIRFDMNSGNVKKSGDSSNNLATGVWIHLAYTWNSATMIMYINGISNATVASVTSAITELNNTATIGFDSTGRNLDAILDEVEVWNTAWDANWVATVRANQVAPLTFSTIGSQQSTADYTITSPNQLQLVG